MNISAFVDCGAETVVMRVPYELAAQMLAGCPPSADRDELLTWIFRAAARSEKFRVALAKYGVDEKDEKGSAD